MLQASTLAFLCDLSANNTREWFQEHKAAYESARNNFLELAAELIRRIGAFEPEMAALQAKDCVFRLHRDTRFSKDKTPYKTNMGAYFTVGGRHSVTAGYYFHIEPLAESFVAGGVYQPQTAELKKIRQEIDYHGDELFTLVNEPAFKTYFGQLTGSKLSIPPKGYDKNHLFVDFLKHKDFLASGNIDPAMLLSADLPAYVAERFKAIKPLNDFLNRAIGS